MSKETQKVLVVIPARGNSKGIPRKNVRSMNGQPLISYAIRTAQKSKYKPDIFVSSDDEEILSIAKKLHAQTINRADALAEDATTLDPVIYDAFQQAQKVNDTSYDLIVTMQPTSPLLKTGSLDAALEEILRNSEIDTILSAIDDRHLCWTVKDGKYVPTYEARVNRQYLPENYRETGSFLITRSHIISENNRIGTNVKLQPLSSDEAIDIDTYQDWNLCEYLLRKKKILFVVTGYKEVGLGHVYRALILANEILDHEIEFLVDSKSELGMAKIAAKNYPVYIQEEENIIDDINKREADLIINDILDTTVSYVQTLKNLGYKLVNFEDLGGGAQYADLVINAMYPQPSEQKNAQYFGHHYFCIKPEFLFTPKKKLTEKVERILITFGGVDPNNYTLKVLKAVYPFCQEHKIAIDVIAGLGYKNEDTLVGFPDIQMHTDVKNMSDYMVEADIAFTSGGRTTYELASLGIPAIVLCQNERELTHFFASAENGFKNLGLGYEVDQTQLISTFETMVQNYKLRESAHDRMLKQDIESGKYRVINLIKAIITNKALATKKTT